MTTVYVYRLYRKNDKSGLAFYGEHGFTQEEAKTWFPKEKYEKMISDKVVSEVMANDTSDNICIGGIGNDGKHRQFDSYEAYHACAFFEQDFEKHGLYVESAALNIPDEMIDKAFKNVK